MGRVNTVTHCGQNMYVHIHAVNINSLFYKHPFSIPHFPLKELTSGRGKGKVVFVIFSKKGYAEERGNTKKME